MIIDKRPRGQIFLPPSKSISHRVLIGAALSGGGMINNLAENKDTEATIACLKMLGASLVQEGDIVSFTGGLTLPKNGIRLDCGESGSTLRFLIPIVAALGIPTQFTGQGRLMERPLGPYETSLSEHGVTMQRMDDALYVRGKMEPGVFEIPGDVSSQFITGLLFALPLLDDDSEIIVTGRLQSKSYVDLTLDVLEQFRIKIRNKHHERFVIPGEQEYVSCDTSVPADYSGAAFFLAAAALGCDVECMGLDKRSKQGDKAFLEILDRCGFDIYEGPTGGICVSPESPRGAFVDVSDIPDLVPPLAALMCFLPGESRIYNAARLRTKESDRLSAVATELNGLGADVTEGEDYLIIRGQENVLGGKAHAHNDHRIAMMAAIVSLKSVNPVDIDEPDCVNKSYPNFWRDFCHEYFR